MRTEASVAKVAPTLVASPPRPTARRAPPPRTVAVRMPRAAPPAGQSAPVPRIPSVTLRLILGHYFERLVRDGIVRDLTEIACRTGLTKARVSQVADLTLLAPRIQEEILKCEQPPLAKDVRSERVLREIARNRNWQQQEDQCNLTIKVEADLPGSRVNPM